MSTTHETISTKRAALLRHCSVVLILASLTIASPSSAQYAVEVTFDDEEEGTGAFDGHAELDNLEGNGVPVQLVDAARRTGISDGRYGRAVDFPAGDGGVAVGGWEPRDMFIAHLWLRARDTSSGMIIGHGGSWVVGLSAGALSVTAWSADGASDRQHLGIEWPTDGRFHHLTVRYERSSGETRFFSSIDFGPETAVSFSFEPAPSTAPLRLGQGLDGMIDEVIIANRSTATVNAEYDRFKRWGADCIDGLECLEEVFTMVPRGFSHEVPVRLKTVYDPETCTEAAPCPLLVTVSGGGTCANDYANPVDVAAYVELGFLVATVDLYCESSGDTLIPGNQTSQLIAAKDYALEESENRSLIAGASYSASGCSFGASAVQVWALLEEDHPARTFVRSASGSGICAHLAGKICGWTAPPTLDLERPGVQEMHESTDVMHAVTAEIAGSREVFRSWGANLEGPVCNADGSVACSEEGKHAMTYASRRFRDQWERLQPAGMPTGYFVEDRGDDCRHCAPPDSEAFRCGACGLRYGRVGMESACPECLAYEEPTASHGEPAELCPIDASWYQDPLATAAPDAGTHDGGAIRPDAGVDEADASPAADATVAPPDEPASAGCHVSRGGGATGWLWAFPTLLLAVRIVTRRKRSTTRRG